MRRDVFQAIADPNRRAIILMLAAQTMTPNALAEHFQCTRQAVSKHIQILADCNLVTQERQGRTIYYHLNTAKMNDIEVWLEQFRKIMRQRFDQLDEVLLHLKSKKS